MLLERFKLLVCVSSILTILLLLEIFFLLLPCQAAQILPLAVLRRQKFSLAGIDNFLHFVSRFLLAGLKSGPLIVITVHLWIVSRILFYRRNFIVRLVLITGLLYRFSTINGCIVKINADLFLFCWILDSVGAHLERVMLRT